MDDLQLQGRLKRYPQSKQVEIYRFIGARTADETINKLSTGKGAIHEIFTGAPLAFRKLLVSLDLHALSRPFQKKCYAVGSPPRTTMTMTTRK